MKKKARVILEADNPEDLQLALQAQKWLWKEPMTQKDAILSYHSARGKKIYFYVRRTKTGISSRQCH